MGVFGKPRMWDKRFTVAQSQRIRNEYDGTTETINRLQADFKCPRRWIHCYVKQLGLARTHRPRWTDEELEYLMENWGETDEGTIARKLNRTKTALNLKAKSRGINRTQNAGHYNTRVLAELLEIDSHKITDQWFRLGLKAHLVPLRARRVWHIRIEDLKSFLRKWPEAYNYREASEDAIMAMEFEDLPNPPKEKMVACRARMAPNVANGKRQEICDAFEKLARLNEKSKKDIYRELAEQYGTTPDSMKEIIRAGREEFIECAQNPTLFWVLLYAEHPRCPRCGRQVSMYAVDGVRR